MACHIVPAIMSGGSGTRLWPTSSDARPKQFHSLGGADTLIQRTVARLRDTEALTFDDPIFLCNESHAALVAEQMNAIGRAPMAIVMEPVARNTAPIAAVAAALVQELAPDALILLLPADHLIMDEDAFLETILRAAPLARDHIVTFGIQPDRPETGYGYIQRGDALSDDVFQIASFREKPNRQTAAGYLADGGYCWNSGMFLFDPGILLQEFAHAPVIRDHALASVALARRDGPLVYLDAASFAASPSQPLDIAVMEKTTRGAVAPCSIGWADLGAWDEIWRISEKDVHGNTCHGTVASLDAHGNLIRSDGPRIAIAGVDDLIVIATHETVLVLPKARAQDVKALREAALLAWRASAPHEVAAK